MKDIISTMGKSGINLSPKMINFGNQGTGLLIKPVPVIKKH